jgi:hypothetical protein
VVEDIVTEKNKVIGFIEFFGKVDAIVIKNGKIELQETEIKRPDCWCKD